MSSAPKSLPASILVTRHDKIGDFILALPLCKAIKTQYPHIRIAMLVAPVTAALASEAPFIDQVVVYDPAKPEQTLAEVRALKPDASISCYIDTALGWLLWRAGIKQRVAPATKLAQLFFNQRISQRRSRVEKPEFAYNLDLGHALLPELNTTFPRPLLEFPVAQEPGPRRVVFHPGFGGSSDGNLSLHEYLRLARRAAALSNTEVIFTFGPDDTALYEQVEKQLDFPARLINGFASLRAFCEFLHGCTLFVSTSTGPMHLAGAVNTPTLSFFGDSLFASSARWQTVSDPKLQNNFMLGANYTNADVDRIEQRLLELLA